MIIWHGKRKQGQTFHKKAIDRGKDEDRHIVLKKSKKQRNREHRNRETGKIFKSKDVIIKFAIKALLLS